jgi:large subunit ribosomal protein L28
MAAVCEICGKGPGFGKSVSHSHRRTSRRWDPNIQTVRAVTRPGGNKKRINVCTSCIKAGKVSRGQLAAHHANAKRLGGKDRVEAHMSISA